MATSTNHDWWTCLEEREATFITEDKDEIREFVEFGSEHLSLPVLRKNGLSKVLKIRENIIELKDPLDAQTLSVDVIATVLGDKYKVPVIEATSQQEVASKSMKEWRQYYNQEACERDQILNVISLEFSSTRLAEFAKTPRAIREIDWINHVWPHDLRGKGEYPGVQQYLLMAAAGSYTNFHIDFGGSSVWYDVVKGEKIFILCPPTEQNLKEFQKWHLTSADEANYFTDNVDTTIMCVIEEGTSIVIPSGWIHAVYTPKDSVAFGGNFLHGYSFEMQLKIHGIEENLQDPLKYRFPYFEEMMWYVAQHYVDKLKVKNRQEISSWEQKGLAELVDWLKYYKSKKPSGVKSAQYINDALRSFLKNEEIPLPDNYIDDDVEDEEAGSTDCICNGKADDQLWIGCSSCGGWYHAGCVGLSQAEVERLDNYYCPKCTNNKMPGRGRSTAAPKQLYGSTAAAKRKNKRKAGDSPQPRSKKAKTTL